MVIHPGCVGTFFPSDADELRTTVKRLLASAPHCLGENGDEGGRRGSRHPHPGPLPQGEGATCPKAIIAPHAGYDYSGQVAATAYATIVPWAETIRRVVLLGTCHVAPVSGLLTTSAEAIATPLGTVPVDQDAVGTAARLQQVTVDNDAHRADHSLAVQLPFLQTVLKEFQVVPFLAGRATAEDVAAVLELLWGGEETLVVVSSDLSHFLDYKEACRRDRDTAAAVVAFDRAAIGREEACGHRAIAGLLVAGRRHRLRATTLDVRNSGDTGGDRDRVVGYGAFVLEPQAETEDNSCLGTAGE